MNRTINDKDMGRPRLIKSDPYKSLLFIPDLLLRLKDLYGNSGTLMQYQLSPLLKSEETGHFAHSNSKNTLYLKIGISELNCGNLENYDVTLNNSIS